MYASKQVSLKLLPPLTTYYVKLCLTAYHEEKMVSYPNSELCNTWGNLRNRCKSTSMISSQIYPLLNNSIYDSMCNEEWSELMCNLRELPGGSYVKNRICSSLFIYIPRLLVTSFLKHERGLSSVFYFYIYARRFLYRTHGIFVDAQFSWLNDIDIPQGGNNVDPYLVT